MHYALGCTMHFSPYPSPMPLTIRAPGTSANLGPGFDCLGLALDIWGTAAEFHFAYQQLAGDGEIVARVVSLTNTDQWAKAGVMLRGSLDATTRRGRLPSRARSSRRTVAPAAASSWWAPGASSWW